MKSCSKIGGMKISPDAHAGSNLFRVNAICPCLCQLLLKASRHFFVCLPYSCTSYLE